MEEVDPWLLMNFEDFFLSSTLLCSSIFHLMIDIDDSKDCRLLSNACGNFLGIFTTNRPAAALF
jgi:hypothetical protein